MIIQKPNLVPSPSQSEQIKRQFGMFIHFGINTFGNVEWSEGRIDALSYRPTEIDTNQWVQTAYEAGMNYVILTAKHHDGFCLWKTKTTKYSVDYAGNTQDVVQSLAKSCHKYGIKLGIYYSIWDRNYAGYENDFSDCYIPYMLAHLTELLDGRYGEIVEL